MKYERDLDMQTIVEDIVRKLNLHHVDTERIVCVKSHGSKSRRTLARIHGLPKIMQKAMNIKALYVIELISENFDNLSHEDKIKTLVHEVMHVPKNFGGGFRSHRPYVTRKNVDKVFEAYMKAV
jgi:predicted metallopeptidase